MLPSYTTQESEKFDLNLLVLSEFIFPSHKSFSLMNSILLDGENQQHGLTEQYPISIDLFFFPPSFTVYSPFL